MSRLLPRLATVILVLVSALASAAPALGHADLVASNPDDKAVLAAPPTVVTLRFSEGLDAGKSRFLLEGPAGEAGTGRAANDGGKVMTLDGLALGPGDYTVKWTAAAQDGHVERGTFSFTVLAPTPAPATPPPSTAGTGAPTATASASASPAAPSPSASVEPVTSPAARTPSTGGGDQAPAAASGGDVVMPIIAALALVAGIGVLVLRRSRRA